MKSGIYIFGHLTTKGDEELLSIIEIEIDYHHHKTILYRSVPSEIIIDSYSCWINRIIEIVSKDDLEKINEMKKIFNGRLPKEFAEAIIGKYL